MSRRPSARVAALLVLALAASVTAEALPAGAQTVAPDYEYTCPKSSGYDCMPGTGYTGQSVWGSFGPGHNCVSYVTYMLRRNGAERPWAGRLGDGADWDENARAAGWPVDTTPTVGSIAQWEGDAPGISASGHIAYVDAVTPDYILVSEDNYAGFSAARKIYRSGPTFATAEFIHIRDLPSAPADDVLWAGADGTASMWWGLADGPGADGTPFRPADTLLGVTRAAGPVPGDLDADGTTDLVLHEPGSTTARVAWGDGSGGFATAAPRAVPGGGRAQVSVGDFDGDGVDDVLWYAPGPAADAVWWGQASARQPEVEAVEIDGDYLPAVADLDGDGSDDIVLAGPGDAVDRVIWGTVGGRDLRTNRLPPTRLSASARPVVGDFDGDGLDDVVWSRPGPAPDAVWWGDGGRQPEHERIDLDEGQEARAGDFDGDGVDDLLLVGTDGNDDALVLGESGQRRFRPAAVEIAAPAGATPVVADFGSG